MLLLLLGTSCSRIQQHLLRGVQQLLQQRMWQTLTHWRRVLFLLWRLSC